MREIWVSQAGWLGLAAAVADLMLGLVQHEPARLPRFQQGTFLEQNAFKTPVEGRGVVSGGTAKAEINISHRKPLT